MIRNSSVAFQSQFAVNIIHTKQYRGHSKFTKDNLPEATKKASSGLSSINWESTLVSGFVSQMKMERPVVFPSFLGLIFERKTTEKTIPQNPDRGSVTSLRLDFCSISLQQKSHFFYFKCSFFPRSHHVSMSTAAPGLNGKSNMSSKCHQCTQCSVSSF